MLGSPSRPALAHTQSGQEALQDSGGCRQAGRQQAGRRTNTRQHASITLHTVLQAEVTTQRFPILPPIPPHAPPIPPWAPHLPLSWYMPSMEAGGSQCTTDRGDRETGREGKGQGSGWHKKKKKKTRKETLRAGHCQCGLPHAAHDRQGHPATRVPCNSATLQLHKYSPATTSSKPPRAPHMVRNPQVNPTSACPLPYRTAALSMPMPARKEWALERD